MHNTQPQVTSEPLRTDSDLDSSVDGTDVDSTTSTPQIPPPDPDATDGLEPWVDWIKRCTHEVEQRMRKLKLDDRITVHRRRKWNWAQKLALRQDFDWTVEALQWDPTLDSHLNARRRPGRPKIRWTDDIQQHLRRTTASTSQHHTTQHADSINRRSFTDEDDKYDGQTPSDNKIWLAKARDTQLWAALEDEYVNRCAP